MTTRKKSVIIKDKSGVINTEETLFQQRKIFLYSQVDDFASSELITQMFTLDIINHEPIHLYLNSPGGSVDNGFAIIDTMNTIKSPVYVYAQGCIASMAALIFIAGKKRFCYKNTTIMFHDMFAGAVDYSQKLKARMEFYEKEWDMIVDHIKKYTELDQNDISAMRSGELWLFAEGALNKKCVDVIL